MEEFRELERAADTALDVISEPVICLDKDLKIMWANRAAGESAGIEPSGMKGCYCYEIWDRGQVQGTACPAERVLQTGRPQNGGINSHCIVKAYPVHSSDGELAGVVEVFGNSSREKSRDNHYRVIFETCSTGMVIIDEDTTISLANSRFEQLSGYSRTEIEGKKTWTDFAHPADLERMKKYHRLRRQQPGAAPRQYEFSFVDRSGNTRDIFLSVDLIPGTKKSVASFLDITGRKQAEEILRQQQELLEVVINSVTDVLAIQYPDYTIDRYNQAGYELLGKGPEEVRGKKCFELLGRDEPCEPCATQEVLKTRETVSVDKYVPELGLYLNCRSTPVFDEEGNIRRIVEHLRDITEQKEYEKRLQEERDYMFRIFDSMNQYVVIVGSDYRIEFINKAFKDIFGDVYGKTCYGTMMGREKPCAGCPAVDIINNNIYEPAAYTVEVNGRNLEGSIARLENLDRSVSALCILKDITEQKQAEERIRYLSFYDQLTGIYNRAYVEEELARLDIVCQFPLSVMMIDVNGLKMVNDTYGHEVGDRMLTTTCRLLAASCREGDLLARWGGDEFVIIMPRTGEMTAQEIARQIRNESSRVFVESIPLQLAVGTASKNNAGEKLWAVLKKAEDRMYSNKLVENKSARSNIILTLLNALKEKSSETEEHLVRLQVLAARVAEALNMSTYEMDRLSLLASLHDIGKMVIPEEILQKPGRLNAEEWEFIKKHPEVGARIARSSEVFTHVAEEILSHHERWDGYGYPRGLKDREIPLLARIISIIDAYDVMTNGRPYKTPLTPQEALEEIKRCAGTQFDPNLVEVFINIMNQ